MEMMIGLGVVALVLLVGVAVRSFFGPKPGAYPPEKTPDDASHFPEIAPPRF